MNIVKTRPTLNHSRYKTDFLNKLNAGKTFSSYGCTESTGKMRIEHLKNILRQVL